VERNHRYSGKGEDLKEKNRSTMTLLICALIGAALFFGSGSLLADPNTQKIKLAWDPNNEADLEGYMIYYKCCRSGPPYRGTEAYEGDSPIIVYLEDLQNPQSPQFELTGLSKQNDYYFAVTAFDSEFNESAFSAEASTARATNGSSSEEELSSGDGGGGGGGGCFIQSAAPLACLRQKISPASQKNG
jgi:hypothetical protein